MGYVDERFRAARKRLHDAGPVIERSPHGGTLPASFAQRRLWFLDHYQPDSRAYHVPAVFRLDGPLRIDVLRETLLRLVGTHESLRTRFEETGGDLVQIVDAVDDRADIELPVTDLEHLGADEARRRFADAVAAQHQPAFDLCRGPLLRAELFRFSDTEHRLFLNAHHIVVDGWSLGLLARQLVTYYAALASGAEPVIEPEPLQYADFTRWQRERLTEERLDSEVEHWRATLAGVPDLELPTDRPRPPVRTERGGRLWFDVPAELGKLAAELATRAGATPFAVLLAVYQLLLHRYSRQDRFAVGTPVAGRAEPELAGLVGYLANTVVLTSDYRPGQTFLDYLDHVRDGALTAFEHQELPFELLVERLRPARDPGRTPIFQALFALQNLPPFDRFATGDLTVSALPPSGDVAKFDLALYLHGEPEAGLRGELEYSADLFTAATAQRMAAQYLTLLSTALEEPEAPAGTLDVLPAEQKAELLVRNNDRLAGYPDGTIHGLFEQCALRSPDAVAVWTREEEVRYGELDRRANQLAQHLLALGVRPGQRIGVCLPRSPELIVALLAVLEAGCTYVPLDPEHPAERMAMIVEDTDPAALVTEQSLRTRFVAREARIVCVDSEREAIAARPGHGTGIEVDSRTVAYVLFTSGSTGRPKGVEVEHRSAVNFLAGARELLGFQPGEAMLAIATACFDASIAEFWLPLSAYGRVALATADDARDGSRLMRVLDDSGARLLQATPATWRMLIDAGWQGTPGLTVLSTGEALSAPLAAELRRRAETVWNIGGPTETTVWASGAVVDSDEPPVTFGGPVPNARLYVLDENLRPVPVGVPGELYIGGAGLARGYRGRGGLTAERFVADPFAGTEGVPPGQRLYRSGDLVRWLPGGHLEHLGRVDRQVKIRGNRIELGEIEHALRAHPLLAEAAVVVRGAGEDAELAGFVVVQGDRGDTVPTADELRRFLAGRVPGYMVPVTLDAVDALPLNTNGKVDRGALTRTATSTPLPNAPLSEPPATRTERAVAAIWCGVLGVERVGAGDNFFELGGHSFTALDVQRRVRDELGRDLAVVTLFQHPTVRALAAHLDAEGGEDPAASAGTGPAAGRPRPRRREDVRVRSRRRPAQRRTEEEFE